MKLKKILAAALAGAMVLSVVPAGGYGIAVANAAESQEVIATTEAPSGYELQEISQDILKRNAASNSQNDNPGAGIKGGPAAWAFDEEERWWHSNFTTGHPSEANRIYIQTGFDAIKNIKKLTYTPRTDDKGGIIKNYEIKVSTVDNPGEDQENWTLVKSGTFANNMNEQEIVFTEAVEAKWVRLIATSESYSKTGYGNFATAKKIRVFEEVAVPVTEVTLNVTAANLKVGETVQLTATVAPDNASQEVVWSSDAENIATVEDGMVTANSAGTAIITATSTMNPEKKAQCTVVVTRDDTALDAIIEAAEAKKLEEGYADKYTAASRKALEDALEIARAAKQDAQMGQEEIAEVVKNLQDAIDGLELKAVVTIRNNGTEETKYCEIGEQVRVVAQTVKDKKFSHWTFNGTPICYSSPYTFTVYGNTTIEAVYVDAGDVVTPQAAMMCSASYNKSTQTIKFTAKRSVPEGCKIVKHGMILTSKPAWDALYKDNQEAFKLEANRIITKVATTTGLAGNYSVSVKCTKPNIWYAKGYVVYTDKNGEEQTVYSDVVSYEVK